jgi:protein-S-isoprenylcysteine O-methyltransferase Ste14
MIAGSILLVPWTTPLLGEKQIWQVGFGGAYLLAAVLLGGLGLTWWARTHLGKLWSSVITRKEDHRIIDTGPYGIVRHPIYSGLIIALMATAAAEGRVTALIGAALVILGIWLKASSEERFLMAEFGQSLYGSYCRRVPMLVPFLPRG